MSDFTTSRDFHHIKVPKGVMKVKNSDGKHSAAQNKGRMMVRRSGCARYPLDACGMGPMRRNAGTQTTCARCRRNARDAGKIRWMRARRDGRRRIAACVREDEAIASETGRARRSCFPQLVAPYLLIIRYRSMLYSLTSMPGPAAPPYRTWNSMRRLWARPSGVRFVSI